MNRSIEGGVGAKLDHLEGGRERSIAQELGYMVGTVGVAKDRFESAIADITDQINDALEPFSAERTGSSAEQEKEKSLGASDLVPGQTAIFERPKQPKPKVKVTYDQGGIDLNPVLDLGLGPQWRVAKGIVAATATATAGFTLLQKRAIDETKNDLSEPVSRRQAFKLLAGLGGISAGAGVLAACAPTRVPEKTGSSPPPTASTVIGELTPQARDMVQDYNDALVKYLQTEFPETKGVGGFPILNFIDARVDSNNPQVFSVFSNESGISKVPTDRDLSFVIGGKMFIAIRNSQTGERVIYHVARPDVPYSSMRFNAERSQLEYLDSLAKPVAHISITGNSISELLSDIPSTATPAPTKTNTPSPSPSLTPKPTEAPTVTPSPTATVAPSLTPTREPTAAPTLTTAEISKKIVEGFNAADSITVADGRITILVGGGEFLTRDQAAKVASYINWLEVTDPEAFKMIMDTGFQYIKNWPGKNNGAPDMIKIEGKEIWGIKIDFAAFFNPGYGPIENLKGMILEEIAHEARHVYQKKVGQLNRGCLLGDGWLHRFWEMDAVLFAGQFLDRIRGKYTPAELVLAVSLQNFQKDLYEGQIPSYCK